MADGDTAPPPRPALWLAMAAGLVLAGGLAWLVVGDVVGGVLALALVLAAFGALVQTVRLALRRRQHGYALQLAADAAARRQEADVEQQERLRRRRRELEALLDRSAWTTSARPRGCWPRSSCARTDWRTSRASCGAWASRTATSGGSRRSATRPLMPPSRPAMPWPAWASRPRTP